MAEIANYEARIRELQNRQSSLEGRKPFPIKLIAAVSVLLIFVAIVVNQFYPLPLLTPSRVVKAYYKCESENDAKSCKIYDFYMYNTFLYVPFDTEGNKLCKEDYGIDRNKNYRVTNVEGPEDYIVVVTYDDKSEVDLTVNLKGNQRNPKNKYLTDNNSVLSFAPFIPNGGLVNDGCFETKINHFKSSSIEYSLTESVILKLTIESY